MIDPADADPGVLPCTCVSRTGIGALPEKEVLRVWAKIKS